MAGDGISNGKTTMAEQHSKKENKDGKKTEWKAVVVKWIGLFPALLVIAYTTKYLGIKPMPVKLAVETAIVVPLVHYVIGPKMKKFFHDWVYEGKSVSS